MDIKELKVTFDRQLNYDAYSIDEIYGYEPIDDVEPEYRNIESKEIESFMKLTEPSSGPMDSPWPMYCHDARHTGRSLFSSAGNPGFEKWFFKTGNHIEGSGAIDQDEIIYFGSHTLGSDDNFFAMYPNGTIKWSYDINGNVEDTGPAIDENGIIYIGTKTTVGNRMFAFYPNGTVKWYYKTDEWIYGSPVIGDDGSIYFAGADGYPWYGYVYSLYSNGTLKWKYKTNDVIYSDPAIGLDGTVYCGCYNGNLYALYSNNGTLKWSYSTGGEVKEGACITDDGTVIFGSWDGHVRALYPNGTLKWKSVFGRTNPVIGSDGTIYVGSDCLTAINPDDGSIKWTYDVPGDITDGNPCVSADGIIYCGTTTPGYLVAMNSDGTERWRKYIGGKCLFAPIIGEDGTVYIGSSHDEYDEDLGGYVLAGYLHAFNELDPDAPSEPTINGPDEGRVETKYEFSFKATSPLGKNLSYWVDWGDLSNTGWIGPYKSGEIVVLEHAFLDWPTDKKVYNVRIKARDEDDRWGPWGYHTFNRPRNRPIHSSFLLRFLDMFPLLQKILKYILTNTLI